MWKLFDQLLLFLSRLFLGLKFAAIEYDEQLKRTKTPKQRFVRWLIVVIVVLIVLYVVGWLLQTLMKSIRISE